jgi:hypothetical protein
VRPNLEYASSVWSPHQACYSGIRIEKYNTISYDLLFEGWTVNPLPAYDSRCALLGLESLEDRRTVASALFIRDLLCDRIDSVDLSSLLKFESNPYARRRNAKLVPFFHLATHERNRNSRDKTTREKKEKKLANTSSTNKLLANTSSTNRLFSYLVVVWCLMLKKDVPCAVLPT